MEGLPEASFHDAEVLEVRLSREGLSLEMLVDLYAQTPRGPETQRPVRSSIGARTGRFQRTERSLRPSRGGNGRWVLGDKTPTQLRTRGEFPSQPYYVELGRWVTIGVS